MKIDHITEPELEFGGDERHIDIRFGISNHGPHDIHSTTAPGRIRLGLVGTEESVDALGAWLGRCAGEIPSSGSGLKNLFTPFPGFNTAGCFHSELVMEPSWFRTISTAQVDEIARHSQGVAVADAVDLIFGEMEDLLGKSKLDVILCAIPERFLHLDEEEDEDLAPEIDKEPLEFETRVDLRSYLKAKSMKLGVPIQLVLPATYGGKQAKRRTARRKRDHRESDRRLQDEATRAWNLHTALYYKAGGRPWRIPAQKSDLLTCFVGVSFYRTLEQNSLQTSVAQVYNERGEGVVVRGETVRVTKEDPVPHLSAAAAESLLKSALQRFWDEHKTKPARLVLHKSSKYSLDEIAGFTAATKELYATDLLTIDKSFIRLYRQGRYPPLRGTMCELDRDQMLLYTRGTVDFFSTYPGQYIPRPLLIRRAVGSTPMRKISAEILALTKLNWNNTQFDGSLPITLRVAQQVGKILKYVPAEHAVQPRYAFYM